MVRGVLAVLAAAALVIVSFPASSQAEIPREPRWASLAVGGQEFGPGTDASVVVAQLPEGGYFAGEGASCSGVLIAPRIVLTAAHCVLTIDGDELLGLDEYYVVGPGADFVDANAHWSVPVEDIAVGPFRWTDLGEARTTAEVTRVYAGDYAVITLALPLPMKQSIRLATPEDVGILESSQADAYVIGYGSDDEGEVLKKPVSVPSRLFSPSISADVLESARAAGLLVSEVSDEANAVCKGDSGGPLIGQVGREWVLLGLTAGGTETGRCGLDSRNIGGRDVVLHSSAGAAVDLIARAETLVQATPMRGGYCEAFIEDYSDVEIALGDRDIETDCYRGRTWRTSWCSRSPRLNLEVNTGTSWRSLKRLRGVKDPEDECDPYAPYLYEVSRRINPGDIQGYQLRAPGGKKYEARFFVHGFSSA